VSNGNESPEREPVVLIMYVDQDGSSIEPVVCPVCKDRISAGYSSDRFVCYGQRVVVQRLSPYVINELVLS